MHGFHGERMLMRIHVGERDRHGNKSLYEAIVTTLREHGCAGATVYRAVMGFGASARLHSDRVEVLSLDLPIVIECVETQGKLDEVLPIVDEMIGGGLITLERVNVIIYRPDSRERN